MKNIPAQMSRDINVLGEELLLQGLRGGNSQVNGHTDHGGATRPPPVAEKGRGASGSGRRKQACFVRCSFSRAPQQGEQCKALRFNYAISRRLIATLDHGRQEKYPGSNEPGY